jgi:hypothetical protein
MALSMTRPWKHPKTGMYWLRRRVPEDLREIVGKTEEKRSLKTKDPAEARMLLAQALTDLDTKWANLRRGPVVLSDTEAHQLASVVYKQWFKQYKDNPSDQKLWNVELGPSAVWNLGYPTIPAHLIPAYENMYGMQERFHNWADELLASFGLTVDKKASNA